MYEKAVDANNNGDHFTLWGTCQGFQLLNIMTSGNWSILTRNAFNSENISLALDLQPGWNESRLLGTAPKHIIDILSTQNVTLNLHHDGVTPRQ